MLAIPFSDEPGTYKLFLLIEEENLDRMKRADPAQFRLPPSPQFAHMRLLNIFVTYITEGDKKRILDLIHANDVGAVLRWLNRGFEYRPDLGDHDGPPLSLRDKGERRQ